MSSLPPYASTGQKAWFYGFRVICGLIFFFLIAPIIIIIPLSFNAEDFFTFTPGMLALDPDAPAMVLITHHVEEIPPGFTNLMMLSEGQVTAQGPIADTLTAENLTRTFRQNIALTQDDGRYFARRARRAGGHRRAAER